MKASLFYLPMLGNRSGIDAGLAGLRPDLCQQMLGGRSPNKVRVVDDLGYDFVIFI